MLPKLVAGALLAVVASAQAVEVPVQKGAEAAADAAPDDVICTYESSTGSHLKHRVCATRRQREESAAADREAMSKLRESKVAGGTAGK